MGCCASAKTVAIDEITVSIFGLNNAGKTCILHALSGNYDFDCVPTIGFAQQNMMYDNTKLTIYDLGGNPKFRSVWERYYAYIFGFLYVIDSSDREKFDESKDTLEKILSHPMMAGKPYVIIANKQDIDGCATKDEIRKIFEVPENVKIYDSVAIEVKDNHCHPGVLKSLESLIEVISQKYQAIQTKRIGDMKEQEEIEKREHEEKMKRIQELREKRETGETPNSSVPPSTDNATETNGSVKLNASTTLESNHDIEKENVS